MESFSYNSLLKYIETGRTRKCNAISLYSGRTFSHTAH